MKFIILFSDKGATYEFRVQAKNEVGYGERASSTIATPDGGTCHYLLLSYIAAHFICINGEGFCTCIGYCCTVCK